MIKTIFTVIGFILVLYSEAFATWHLYLMPYVNCTTFIVPCQPNLPSKQPDFGLTQAEIDAGAVVNRWAVYRYGGEPTALTSADVSDSTDKLLTAKPIITKIPDNLDQQIGAALTTVQKIFEALNFPADWITATNTYRELIRWTIGPSTYLLRYRSVSGNYGPIFVGGITLSSTFGSLPAKARADMIETANQLELDVSKVTASTTLRQILTGIGNQYMVRSYQLGGITI